MPTKRTLANSKSVIFKWPDRGLTARLLNDWRPIAEEVRDATGMSFRALGISAIAKRPDISQAEAIKLHLLEIIRQLSMSRTLSTVAAEYQLSPDGDNQTPLEEWLNKYRNLETT